MFASSVESNSTGFANAENNMKGVSLLETVVVIALIAFMSTIGTNIFINFKNDTTIDNLTNELISDIKLARNKSMNGELLDGETANIFDPDGLPEYGLNLSANSYQIVRQCSKSGDVTACSGESIENFTVDPEYKLSSSTGNFYFERITGKTDSLTLTVMQKNDKYGREITISSDFLITVSKP